MSTTFNIKWNHWQMAFVVLSQSRTRMCAVSATTIRIWTMSRILCVFAVAHLRHETKSQRNNCLVCPFFWYEHRTTERINLKCEWCASLWTRNALANASFALAPSPANRSNKCTFYCHLSCVLNCFTHFCPVRSTDGHLHIAHGMH